MASGKRRGFTLKEKGLGLSDNSLICCFKLGVPRGIRTPVIGSKSKKPKHQTVDVVLASPFFRKNSWLFGVTPIISVTMILRAGNQSDTEWWSWKPSPSVRR